MKTVISSVNGLVTYAEGNKIILQSSDEIQIKGDLTIAGTTTTNARVDDRVIELAYGSTGSADNAHDSGIIVERGDDDNVFFGWDESADVFTVGTGEFTGTTTGALELTLAGIQSQTLSAPALTGSATITVPESGLIIGSTEVNATAAELNLLDGSAKSASSITVADDDAILIIDGTTTKQIPASDLKTYVGSSAGGTSLANLDIDGGTDIGAALVDADLLIVDDGASGTNRKTAMSRVKTYVSDLTLTTAAQTNVTSLGTLTALTVDNISLDGTTIGHTSDTDLITLADGIATVAGELSVTTLDIGGVNVTSTPAELNLLDGSAKSTSSITVADDDALLIIDGTTTKQIPASDLKTYVGATAGSTAITTLDIDGGTDIGEALVDADLLIVDNGAGGTNRKTELSRIKTYVSDLTLTTAAQTAITSVGTLSALTISGDLTVDTSTLKVDSSNNSVGIGTASPDAAQSLHVYGGDETTAKFEDSTGKSILLDGNSLKCSHELYLNVGSGKAIYFQDGGTNNGIIDASGNLGIGTISPSMKLHVVGGDETTAKFEDSSGKFTLIDGNSVIASSEMYVKVGSGKTLYFQDGSSTNAVIDGSGNVGIGTLSPTEALDINSDAIRIRSSQTPASASATGTAGMIAWDANYIYVCVDTNTWKRVAISTW